MIVLSQNQLNLLRKAGLLPHPTPKERLATKQHNAEILRILKHPTRAESKRSEKLKRWLFSTNLKGDKKL